MNYVLTGILLALGSSISLADVSQKRDVFAQQVDQVMVEEAINEQPVDWRPLEKEYQRHFDEYYGDGRLAALEFNELEQLLAVAADFVAIAQNSRALDHQKRVLDEIQIRGKATRRHFVEMQQSFIAVRNFDAARELAKTNANDLLQSVPAAKSLPGKQDYHTYWIQNPQHQSLEQVEFPLGDSKGRVVVVYHPHCGFTRSALQALNSDDSLIIRDLLKDTIWLLPPDGELVEGDAFGEVEEPAFFSWGYAHSANSWPEINMLSVPRFYFFDGQGRMVGAKIGWQKDEQLVEAQLAEIKALFQLSKRAN